VKTHVSAQPVQRLAPQAGRRLPGPVLFARYAYPPNALGYCGPGDPDALHEMASRGTDVAALGRLARQFEGAWPYLRLIASCAGIPDPLDARVVEAYWTGNELLAAVPAASLGGLFRDGLGQRDGCCSSPVASSAPDGVAQHNFHVFAVYPWLGLLRAGKRGAPLEILDRCRIRWGQVEEVDGDLATVRSRPLQFDGSHLTLGHEHLEQAKCGNDLLTWIPELEPGETVSLHWDWVCDRLSPTASDWLRYCTARNLETVNPLRG
jgi:hypothetical protein